MDINASITAKVAQFEDLKKQIIDINNKIGALQEQGRALHQMALEVRGGINALAQLQADEDDKAAKAKAALTLPDKSLVAADGKTVIADASAPVAPAVEAPAVEAPKAETPAAPVAEKAATVLEVK